MKSRNFIVLPHNGSTSEKRRPRFGDAARVGEQPSDDGAGVRMSSLARKPPLSAS